jgi:hypothetical protein
MAAGFHRNPPPVQFVADSLLEGAGFEPSVPREVLTVLGSFLVVSADLSTLPSRKRSSQRTQRWRGQSGANSSLKPNSLLAGKIQGISSILASVT